MIRRIATAVAVLLVIAIWSCPRRVHAADSDSHDLFARSASTLLDRKFNAPDLSYLLLDLADGKFIASRWNSPDEAVPIGSLVKPFTAAAYAETHFFRFPHYTCEGRASCWLPRGHGQLGIVGAVAQSCNSYFTQLAAEVTPVLVAKISQQFGLNGPGSNASAEDMAGKNGAWRETPMAVARAYAELLRRRSQPGASEIIAGMAGSAQSGTAQAIFHAVPGIPALAKTGTAPCTHRDHAPGDGFVVVAWPADSPRYLLLVRQHGAPGSHAAATAGRMLRELEPAQ